MKIFRLILPLAMFFLFFTTTLQAKELTQAERNDIAAKMIPIYAMLLGDDVVVPTPTLTKIPPSKVSSKNLSVEVNGKVGTKIYVDGIDQNITIGADGKATLPLHLQEGNNSIKITLKDTEGHESGVLEVQVFVTSAPTPTPTPTPTPKPYDKRFEVSNNQEYVYSGYSDSGIPSHDIVFSLDGKTMYMAENYMHSSRKALRIIDISNLSDHKDLATMDFNASVSGLVPSPDGNTVYIANGSEGLKIIDVSNPASPTQLGAIDTNGYAVDVTLSSDGKTAYVGDGSAGLKIINVSNPASPTLLGAIDTNGSAFDVTLSPDGKMAYVVEWHEVSSSNYYRGSLKIIDVSNPASPTQLGATDTNGSAHDVALSPDGKTVYVVDREEGLKTIDVSNPASPTQLGSIDVDIGSIDGVSVNNITLSSDGKTAYVTEGREGLKVIDVSNPTAPTHLRTIDAPAYSVGGVILSPNGKMLYIIDSYWGSITIMDLYTPATPTQLGAIDTNGSADAVTLSSDGNTAYVADREEGLKIIGVSNPASPTQLGAIDTNGYANAVTLSPDGKTAYVADEDAGLKIIDVSNPASPTQLGAIDTNGSALAVTLSPDGNTAYVADGGEGLKIIDVSNPASPTQLGAIDTNGYAVDVTLSPDGKTAYVADRSKGLKIIDVSNPATPTQLGAIDTNGYTSDVTLSPDGNTAYVTTGYDEGLSLIDVSIPTAPTLLNAQGDADNVTLSADGTKAYVSSGSYLKIIDISNPMVLTQIGTFYAGTYMSDMIISADGKKAYVTAGKGLKIIDITTPTSTHYQPKNFTNASIELIIDSNNTATTFTLGATADRTDIVTIGSFDKTLSYDEYHDKNISIPIEAIADITGQTIITLTLSDGNQTYTRKAYFNVYP